MTVSAAKHGKQRRTQTHRDTDTQTSNFELFMRRAWSVLFLFFYPVFCFIFVFYHVFCFVLVFVPVKRTPRIRAESLVGPLFFYPVFSLILVFLPCILFRFGFCSGKEDPKDSCEELGLSSFYFFTRYLEYFCFFTMHFVSFWFLFR